jgi:hypothetical protein
LGGRVIENLVALAIVLRVVAALMVLAAVSFYALAALCVVYGPMRLSAAIYERWHRQ